jgi:hypothetical protein
MISGTASGNPGAVASPITWNASLVQHHLVLLNAIFATIQVLLGIGIAWRPAVRVALAASIAWALGVWWFGEGLGMVLTGDASPVNGASGAVIIYALLAVLLWPSDRPGRPAPFTAARAVGVPVARALWLVLWLSLAWFALLPGNRAPQALHDMIAGMTDGEPGWLAALDRGAASLVAHQGLAASVVLAIALVIVAAGVYLPARYARGTLVLAIVIAAVIWVFGQAFGAIMTGGGTDPNSGPLLALLAGPGRSRDPGAHRPGGGGRRDDGQPPGSRSHCSCWPWPVMSCSSTRPRSTTGRRSTRPSTGMAASLCGTSRRCSTRWSSARRSCRSPTRRSPRSCSLRGAVRRSRPGRPGWRCSRSGCCRWWRTFPWARRVARAAAAFSIAAVGIWLEPVAMTLFFGQINLVLLLAARETTAR